MSASAEPLDALLERWRHLSRGDRNAILRHMPAERRIDLQQALAERSAASAFSGQHGNQATQAAYSPWLAQTLEAIDSPEDAEARNILLPRPAAREALSRARARAQELTVSERRPSLLDLARSLLFEGSGRK
ncbi:hypothetical protein U8326_11600 [Tsuneonella sp. CC-YZS046]|uniref:hypothetical protein n=1 Tax=Tsuneonella sp. CC-YZS046 TaxID=3042152 RepID=UPI002D764D4F|nr:hypothetical protein [Tsuneonella sp. CC-YZS046]WRO65693.1 hypothetical protein U8326_11600 [Tsuneonella sp. CC-YZS046]